jgi:hypothetical protein
LARLKVVSDAENNPDTDVPTFTVHEPPNPPADRIDRAEVLVFVRDGFSWTAALLAPLWLLARRLWWPLLGYVLIACMIGLVGKGLRLGPSWIALGVLALHLLTGLEADALLRLSFDRRGWSMLGTVSGRSREECERRFFDAWLSSQPIIAPGTSVRYQTPRRWWPIGALLGSRT